MRADILGYHIKLIGRQEESVASCVTDIYIIAADTVDLKVLDAHILTDTVYLVYYEISDLKVVVGKYRLCAVLLFSLFLEL